MQHISDGLETESQGHTPGQTKSSKPLVPSMENRYREAECLMCRDGRWVCRSVPVDDPDFGRAVPCPNCCADEERRARYKGIGVPEARWENRLSTLIARAGMVDMLEAAEAYLKEPLEGFMLIYGPRGSGKTHCAYGVALDWADRGKSVKFGYLPTLMSDLRKAMVGGEARRDELAEDLVDTLCDVDLLVLDDVGAEQGTPWQAARLEEIINRRYANALATIATTELNIKPAAGVEPGQVLPGHIFSKFSAGKLVLNSASDYRNLQGRERAPNGGQKG